MFLNVKSERRRSSWIDEIAACWSLAGITRTESAARGSRAALLLEQLVVRRHSPAPLETSQSISGVGDPQQSVSRSCVLLFASHHTSHCPKTLEWLDGFSSLRHTNRPRRKWNQRRSKMGASGRWPIHVMRSRAFIRSPVCVSTRFPRRKSSAARHAASTLLSELHRETLAYSERQLEQRPCG